MDEKQMAAPTEIWCVVDDLGNICHSASWPQAAHDHINDALQEHGLDEAATWVVRRYVLREPTHWMPLPPPPGEVNE